LPDRSSVHDRAPSSGFIEPCLPTKAARPPSGPHWVHEIKHDGYRLIVQRDGKCVRLFTRDGLDWSNRFSLSQRPRCETGTVCLSSTARPWFSTSTAALTSTRSGSALAMGIRTHINSDPVQGGRRAGSLT
jgi:hypothetical protein